MLGKLQSLQDSELHHDSRAQITHPGGITPKEIKEATASMEKNRETWNKERWFQERKYIEILDMKAVKVEEIILLFVWEIKC